MFEKKETFQWKTPILILTGVLILSSGIYIGVKTRDTDVSKTKANVEQTNKNAKEVFELNKDCEIWLQKQTEDGRELKEGPIMIGTISKDLLNKSESEIRAYFKDKYPERTIESMNKYEILLSETVKANDVSKANKYTLEEDDGFIGLYKYNDKGDRELIEKTKIQIDSLPQTVQNEIKKGIIVNTEDEAYGKLQDFDI